MCRSHDSDRDGSQEVGIGPGVTCGLTRRAAPLRIDKLGCLQARRNSLDPLCDTINAAGCGLGDGRGVRSA
jgi:hypothetical protein